MHRADDIGTQFAAQCLDMTVDRPRARGVGPVPNLFEQPFPGQHYAGPAGQASQQVEFERSELCFDFGAPHTALLDIDAQVTDDDGGADIVCAVAAVHDPAVAIDIDVILGEMDRSGGVGAGFRPL